jgi:tRNA-2-methylthio-N6-dimethylallyladenosine synthase
MDKKYFIITYGCQMNYSDSERVAGVLENIGYKQTLKIDKADLIVVNMCSIRQSAVDRVYGLRQKFNKFKISNPKLITILTGCILKKDKRKFSEYFDFILDIKDLPNWSKILNSKYKIPNTKCYLNIEPKYPLSKIAYIPISNGCNNFCAYCVVPHVRGPLVHRPVKDIVKEVRYLIKNNYKEIWLLGQNVNNYESQILKINFPKLLEMINNIPGDFWIRFTSSNPKDFSDELIDVMAKCKKITPYLNLPVQSGNNRILKKMNRKYTIQKYKGIIRKIRKKIPNIALSTDIIVGFPGETKKQFEDTAKLLEEIKFDMAYINQYSPRQETSAIKIKDNVSKKEKKERRRILNEILKQTALEKNKKHIGKTIRALPIESKDGFLFGKSFDYKSIKIKGSKRLLGKFIKVKITNAGPWGLKGCIK